jgi:hypothetical protein
MDESITTDAVLSTTDEAEGVQNETTKDSGRLKKPGEGPESKAEKLEFDCVKRRFLARRMTK